MNIADEPTITVIDIEDWSLVFREEKLVAQGHDTIVSELARLTHGEPFRLAYIYATGSELDKEITEAGQVADTMLASRAINLARTRVR
ncbi:MAG: hypothetical protein EOQ39_19025 [Mesorhizobium sp.]|uniref:hypothetical protein n=1 Tax=Mesorhizobium sp. TaxID=1871066 RepID=UPI000FE72D94|nr:hypothetical protein [Mesorhizobium sp.]RWB08734.1 MAG: hypothetical protein EOQ37_04310 [Mesorhizobium sp.]RWB13613.1 MAG: hypothetical protein EOQ39_19025 [Mesorhizobium sp.]